MGEVSLAGITWGGPAALIPRPGPAAARHPAPFRASREPTRAPRLAACSLLPAGSLRPSGGAEGQDGVWSGPAHLPGPQWWARDPEQEGGGRGAVLQPGSPLLRSVSPNQASLQLVALSGKFRDACLRARDHPLDREPHSTQGGGVPCRRVTHPRTGNTLRVRRGRFPDVSTCPRVSCVRS